MKPVSPSLNDSTLGIKNTSGWLTGRSALVLAAFVMAILIYRATQPMFPIAEEHHVAVFGKLENGDWLMQSDEEGKFSYRPCEDFDVKPMLEQAIGYVAQRARWEERGACKSIRAAGLGFYWRDARNQYARVN